VFVSSRRKKVEQMIQAGSSKKEISQALGIARNTVEYHVGRLGEGDPPGPPLIPDLSEQARQPTTREQVAGLLAEGLGRLAIARRLGLSKSTVSYHARRLGEPIDERCARRYDWAEIQRFYDEGHSITECQIAFGFSRETWHSARKRGDVISRPHAMPLEQLLAGERNRGHLKKRLLALGVKRNLCEVCGIAEWNGRPLSLALHHVNGLRHDNRLENLQLLCPNCHSQTENFSGRNGGRGTVEV
jgi:DNA-binding CsgD family transcriptional regulator